VPQTQRSNSTQNQSQNSSNMNTFKFLNSFQLNAETFPTDMLAIRNSLFSMGVCWTDSVKGNFTLDTSFRVVLYTRRDNVDFKNPMVKECNGIVFEYNDGWTLLAMPQYAFCSNKISMHKLNDLQLAGYYDIYKVLDATILTLYFYNGSWRVSSTNGYDIVSMEMVNGMTFMGAIYDLMNTKYKTFNFDNLHTDHSYTIALRHSKYHIFNETKHLAGRTKNIPKQGIDMNSYIMLMAIADLNTFSFNTKHVAGLPLQNPLNIRDITISTLTNYARCSYAKYAKAHQLQDFRYEPLYGYILRARNRNVPDEYSTIFVESELFKVVKNGLYKNNNALRSCDHNELVIQMMTNYDRLQQFKIMFDQFSHKFEILEKNIDSIAYNTIQQIASDEQQSVNPMINDLSEQFKDNHDITVGIIKDAMFSKRNIHYLKQLIE